ERAAALRELKDKVSAKLLERAQEQLKSMPTVPLDSAKFREIATNLFHDLSTNPPFKTKDELESAVTQVVATIPGGARVSNAGQIDARLEKALWLKARELAARYPEDRFAPSTRQTLIRKQLLLIAMGASFGYLPPERRKLIEQIVERTVTGK